MEENPDYGILIVGYSLGGGVASLITEELLYRQRQNEDVPNETEPISANGPLGPVDFVVFGTFFMMREIEIACSKVAHVDLDHDALEVTMRLPVSKNDPTAVGTQRTWGCLCTHKSKVCPYHAVGRQLDRVNKVAREYQMDIKEKIMFEVPSERSYFFNYAILRIAKLDRKYISVVHTVIGNFLNRSKSRLQRHNI